MRRLIHLFVATALMALASSALGIPKLTEVSIERSPSGVSLHILGMELPQPKKLSLQGGKLVVFEFPNTLCFSQKTQKVNEGNVLWVKNVQYTARPPVARVAISLRSPMVVTASPSEKGWHVSFGKPSLPVTATSEKPEIPPPYRSSDQDAMEKAIQLLEANSVSKAKSSSPSQSQT
ncbi:MAG: AMIN domain-containing protein, partial [Fimbriimonadales bacterium]|nr:AMIN domain-containing protein [Fimbriimonadales bacterium]